MLWCWYTKLVMGNLFLEGGRRGRLWWRKHGKDRRDNLSLLTFYINFKYFTILFLSKSWNFQHVNVVFNTLTFIYIFLGPANHVMCRWYTCMCSFEYTYRCSVYTYTYIIFIRIRKRFTVPCFAFWDVDVPSYKCFVILISFQTKYLCWMPEV